MALLDATGTAYEVSEWEFKRALDAATEVLTTEGFQITSSDARALAAQKPASASMFDDVCRVHVRLSAYQPASNLSVQFIRAEVSVQGWYNPPISKHPFGGLPALGGDCERIRTRVIQALTPPPASN